MAVHYDVRDQLRRGTTEVPNRVGGRFAVVTLVPELAYRISDRASARLRVPVHWKTFEERMPEIHRSASGLGDLELLGGYDLGGGPRSSWSLHAALGLTTPTGRTERQPFVGLLAPTPLQLGSGTVDPLLATSLSVRPWTRAWADAGVRARLALMENTDSYRPATVVEATLGGGGVLAPERLRAALHVEWSHVGQIAVAGTPAPNTGRDTIYLAPSVQLRIVSELALEVTARVPIFLDVNQTQFVEAALFAARLSYHTPALF